MQNTIDTNALSQYGFTKDTSSTKTDQLGQDEFMKLMLTQMRHQDPFKPTDNGEFIAQMAQFSTVSGIGEMQKSLETLATSLGNYQTLQTANLVGHNVLTKGDTLRLTTDNTVQAVYETDSTGPVTAGLYNEAGSLVHQVDLGIQGAGQHDFAWDGLDSEGNRLPAAGYTLKVTYGSGEYSTAAQIKIKQEISSVNFSTTNGETILNTTDGLSLNLSQISQIQ